MYQCAIVVGEKKEREWIRDPYLPPPVYTYSVCVLVKGLNYYVPVRNQPTYVYSSAPLPLSPRSYRMMTTKHPDDGQSRLDKVEYMLLTVLITGLKWHSTKMLALLSKLTLHYRHCHKFICTRLPLMFMCCAVLVSIMFVGFMFSTDNSIIISICCLLWAYVVN